MQYRRFGKTNLSMPVFSCGGMRYQQQWTDLPFDDIDQKGQQNLEATIHRALEVGINHIETARGYGSSEMQLGYVLPHFNRDDLIVQTKVGVTENPAVFLADFNTSMNYLKLDHVELLGIHGINTHKKLDYVLAKGGQLDIARQLQKEGRVKHVGFSTHGTSDVICRAIEAGDFDYINLHWYYIYQHNYRAIEAASQRDMGIFIISPNNKGGMLYDPSETLSALTAPLSPMVFNGLFCLNDPRIHTLSLGASKPSDFDEHLKTVALLDDAQSHITPILKRLTDTFTQTHGNAWTESWHVGLPDLADTPGNLNILMILFLYNVAKAFDMTTYAKMRYNLFNDGGDWFQGDKPKSIEHLRGLDFSACLKDSPHKEIIPKILEETFKMLDDEKVIRLSQT